MRSLVLALLLLASAGRASTPTNLIPTSTPWGAAPIPVTFYFQSPYGTWVSNTAQGAIPVWFPTPQFTALPWATALPTATPIVWPTPGPTNTPIVFPTVAPQYTALTWTTLAGPTNTPIVFPTAVPQNTQIPLATAMPTATPIAFPTQIPATLWPTQIPPLTQAPYPTALTWTTLAGPTATPIAFPTPYSAIAAAPTGTWVVNVANLTPPPTPFAFPTQLSWTALANGQSLSVTNLTPPPTMVPYPTPAGLTLTATNAMPMSYTVVASGSTSGGTLKIIPGLFMRSIIQSMGVSDSAQACVHFYNLTFTPPTGNTTNMPVFTACDNSSGLGLADCSPLGCKFSAGISYTITKLPGAADTTSLTAGCLVNFVTQ